MARLLDKEESRDIAMKICPNKFVPKYPILFRPPLVFKQDFQSHCWDTMGQ